MERQQRQRWLISIHAPPRGATFVEIAKECAEYEFQFTPLREGRQQCTHTLGLVNFISIHAPPRGATFSCAVSSPVTNISIHAPPRGATISILKSCPFGIFQFTPLREGRLGIPTVPCIRLISIHAPPRGATSRTSTNPGTEAISIHAPPRGATQRYML